MRKVVLGIVCISFIFLTGCEKNNVGITKESPTQETSEVVKNNLEKLGLTYGQSVKFDDFCESVSDNISMLQEFDSKIQNDYEALDELSTTDILIECGKIEGSYLDNGGTKQDRIVNFLQESTFGFFNIAENMYKYQRGYTETEAYGNLQTLTSFVGELGANYGLQEAETSQLQKYFLENIKTQGEFIPASKELLLHY